MPKMAGASANPQKTRCLSIFQCIVPPFCSAVWKSSLTTATCRLHRLVAVNHGLELIQHRTIPPATLYFFSHDGESFFRGKSLAIRPVGGQRVIYIRDLQNACGKRNLLTLQAVGIARAVLLFVMMTNDRQHVAEGSQRRANPLARD